MPLLKRDYCVRLDDGNLDCYYGNGFWYTEKGYIIKWAILGTIFGLFMLWFIGGYFHAMSRLKKGKPLLGYHRFLVSYSTRKKYGQAGPPQNHFTFYQSAQPYFPPNGQYRQRQDGAWQEPPPLYQNTDAPPQYYAPPGATKTHPNQGMEMPQYGAQQSGSQQSGVVGGSQGDVEQGRSAALPPRPPQAVKAKVTGFLERFRK